TIGPNPGELVVSDTEAAHLLIVSAVDGRTLRTIGDGQLRLPTGIAMTSTRLAVADAGLARVLLFDAAGTLVSTLGDDTIFVRPQGVAWDSAAQRLVVCDSYSGEITILGEDGGVRGMIGGFGSGAGSLVNPIDVTVLSGGTLAVTTGGGEVSMFQLLSTLSPLAPPTGVTAGDELNDDGGAIAIAWSASSDDPVRVTGYGIERAIGEIGQFATSGSVGASTKRWIDRSAVDGICYHYRVVARDGTLEAASAETACAIARNDLPPPKPASLTADAQSPFAATVTWSAVPVRDLGGYALEISTGGASAQTLRVAASATSATVTELLPERSYAVSLRAFDTAGNFSAPVSTTATTYPDVPPLSPAVSVSDATTGGAADVKWTLAAGRVPVSNYRIAATPSIAGWPAATNEWTASPFRIRGLVNTLAYDVTVTAYTPWGRGSEPSAPVRVVPSAPALALPVIEARGWDGTSGIEDAAGFDVSFEIAEEKRLLRFRYRAVGAKLQLLIDGEPIAKPLDDTSGTWIDASVEIEKRFLKKLTLHLLAARNAAFPNPSAQVAVRQLDFVPLAPKDLKSDSFNTVVDLAWTWQEARRDLAATLFRSSGKRDEPWSAVPCRAPQSGRCRDTFRTNGEKFAYRLSIASPAGWTSETHVANGEAKYEDLPPEVTDVVVEPDFFGDGSAALKLTWTALSSASSRNGAPEPISTYRIYRSEAGRLTYVSDATAPPTLISAALFDPKKHAIVIRSVDAQGRESR
ncbi:MAG: fibronectin type III domain-containing protein, partial [Thermoanaerobaculia bacterium]